MAFLHMAWCKRVPTILLALHTSIELEAQASVHGKTIERKLSHLFSKEHLFLDYQTYVLI